MTSYGQPAEIEPPGPRRRLARLRPARELGDRDDQLLELGGRAPPQLRVRPLGPEDLGEALDAGMATLFAQ